VRAAYNRAEQLAERRSMMQQWADYPRPTRPLRRSDRADFWPTNPAPISSTTAKPISATTRIDWLRCLPCPVEEGCSRA
jgi:hypothetical protein